MFQPVDSKVSFPQLEEQILAWWRSERIVERSLQKEGPDFVFYEGPPTSNGKPGIHHVLSRAFKDIILRYRSMRGCKIIGRREGWDTHGLPVEIEVEKQLGFNGKPDIERYGIAEFNARCRENVWSNIQDWKQLTERIAFWLSDDAYITYHNSFIESEWWIFRQLWDRGLLYRDYKVTMHCPRCGTSLSDHEVSLGFRDDVDDPSVWVKFRTQLGGGEAAFVAWTTTPWTLPANVALAVNPFADYVIVRHRDERLVLAADLAREVLGQDVQVEATMRGTELVGTPYQRLFEGVPGPGDAPDMTRAYTVIADEFVSLDDGTGIVHIAPAYGDLEIGRKYGLPTLFSVDLSGRVLPEFGELGFAGKFFKAADQDISANLKQRELLLKSGRVSHSYPFCWRCGTPLLYYAKRSWYIRTTALKDQLVALNQTINWVPEHIRDGRFGNWLENNIDWAISRERYWGTPIPIWIAEDGSHSECISSVAELEQRVGRSLADLDLHRPHVDELSWPAPNGSPMRRIPDVADCWFDSGSMPVAQWHYPFDNQELFARSHPADYICEAVDQTRGWFYTLHAVSTLLFNRPAFQNVICLGHILDEQGQKMSKSKGNVVDPWTVIEEHGVDALRWYMFTASPPGNPRRFSTNLVGESLRQFLLTLWNTYSFFVTYARLDGWTPVHTNTPAHSAAPANPLDQWAMARLHALVREVTAALEAYDVTTAARAIEHFVDELSNWYVRRSRRRFWRSAESGDLAGSAPGSDADKAAAYRTLHECLITVAKLAAPFTPFISEAIYRNLVCSFDPAAPSSVHLAPWPGFNPDLIDQELIDHVEALLRAVSLGRAARKTAGIKVRQPLAELWVRAPTAGDIEGLRRFEPELRDELNVKTVNYLDASTDFVDYRFKPNLRLVGKKYGRLVPAITTALKELTGEAARQAAHTIEGHQPLELHVENQRIALTPDEILVETSSPEGYAVAEDQGTLVALNTTVTEDLRREGLARDLVRNIQDARKNAGFDIADRIGVYISNSLLRETLTEWIEYIKAETLANIVVFGPPPFAAHSEEIELDNSIVMLAVVRR